MNARQYCGESSIPMIHHTTRGVPGQPEGCQDSQRGPRAVRGVPGQSEGSQGSQRGPRAVRYQSFSF